MRFRLELSFPLGLQPLLLDSLPFELLVLEPFLFETFVLEPLCLDSFLLEPFLFDALSFELLNPLPFKLLGLDALSLESLHPLGPAACRRCHTVVFQPPPPRL